MRRLTSNAVQLVVSLSLLWAIAMPINARADTITVVPASPFTGPAGCSSGFSPPQCDFRPFDTSLDLAFQGNGFAQPAVAKDTIPGFAAIHQPQYANDGAYGNGASWIGNSSSSWLKIDLGRTALIDSIIFGRDRLGGFDDRDPGKFTVAVALADNVYANGDDSNDATEYTQVFDSTLASYSGIVNGPETLQASFSAPHLGQFVKLTFFNSGAAIDEVEITGTPTATTDHFLCYKVKPHKQFKQRDVIVDNQFGKQTFTVVRPDTLCVPSTKKELP